MKIVAKKIRLMGALLMACVMLLSTGCGSDDNVTYLPSSGVGIVAFNNGWIGFINTLTKTVSTPFLAGELGDAGNGVLDVVITPDRTTALVSTFGTNTVSFVSMTSKSLLGSVTLSFAAEDISLTPDGKYALVTDGGFSPMIAVIDVENRTLVEEYTSPDINPDPTIEEYNHFQAVAVAADGETVLTVDYFVGQLHVFTINDTGNLTFVESIDISSGGTLYPVNVSISPDGQTAIVSSVSFDETSMRFPVLQITAPGVVQLNGQVDVGLSLQACQSIVFNSRGTYAYAYCTQVDQDPEDEVLPYNLIVRLPVTAPGEISAIADYAEVGFTATGQLYGVDTIALDRMNRYLYISNMTTFGAYNQMQVFDVSTGSVVKTITFDDVEMPPGSETYLGAYPAGVFIR